MDTEKKQIKLTDIAKKAGVSTATVCRVLGEKSNVAPELRLRVKAVIDELGYIPNRVHNRTEPWLAVLTDSSITSFTAQILASIQENALEKGFVAYVIQMPSNPEKRQAVLEGLRRQNWTGIISVDFHQSEETWIQLQEELQVPIVVMNSEVNHPQIACIRVNFQEAISNAIAHLATLGHERIIYLGDLSNQFSQLELAGVEQGLTKSGTGYPDEYRISVAHTAEGASQGISRLMMLPSDQRPTAIIAFDDEFAIHLLNALHYHNLSVPGDVSLVGFDNIPMSARTLTPLTTIDVPKYRIGQQMVDLLVQLVDSRPDEQLGYIIVEGSLVVRNSTGPVRK